MIKEKFKIILQSDEEILWAEGVNKIAYFFRKFISALIFSIIFGVLAFVFVLSYYYMLKPGINFKSIFLVAILVYLLILIIWSIGIVLRANNLFFAVTNKRIIMRSGALNNKFIHYSLKNIGTVEVQGSILDKKGENGSATLIVTVKDFHTNTDGNTTPTRLVVDNLNNAYKAYSLLSEKVDGNNEVLRIKTEK